MVMISRASRAKLDEQLRPMIEDQLLTQRHAAELLGMSKSWVERACSRLGLHTQRTGPRSGPGHPNWAGGLYQCGGYWYRWAPNHPRCTKAGYVLEHRLLMEHKLGRLLLPTEVVHHIDANPANNQLANLELFATNADHLRHELAGRVPNWTPEGFARMQQAGRRTANSRPRARDGRLLPQERPSASPADNSDGAPACGTGQTPEP